MASSFLSDVGETTGKGGSKGDAPAAVEARGREGAEACAELCLPEVVVIPELLTDVARDAQERDHGRDVEVVENLREHKPREFSESHVERRTVAAAAVVHGCRAVAGVDVHTSVLQHQAHVRAVVDACADCVLCGFAAKDKEKRAWGTASRHASETGSVSSW